MCILPLRSIFPFLILSCLVILQSCQSRCTIISLETNGTNILGTELKTLFGNKLYIAFYNIPYAEPPVGKLRFKPPVSRKWLNENTYNYSKPHADFSKYTEDYLYLTIYMPCQKDRNDSFAVLVWIHEYSNLHNPDFLIDEDVIVITVSFRTTILGFLNTQDEFSRGNMGAKDIILALKWIQEYIIYFNGDPNRVTIVGSGMAANVVASFLLSPLAEDLFSRIIIQSGSALSSTDYHSYNFEVLNKLFWNLYGPSKTFERKKLYERLQEVPVRKLQFISKIAFDSTEVRDNQRKINAFGPSIEIPSRGAFMSELPSEIYKKRKIIKDVQVMMGFTSLESINELEGFVNNRQLLTHLNYNFQYLLPFEGIKDEFGSQRYKKIKRKIMDFYFINGTIREQSLKRYAKYLSDQVIYPVLRQARLHTETTWNYVYLYRFSHKGALNIVWDATLSNLNMTGATAGDEICYQFRCKYIDDVYNNLKENDKDFIKRVARLLANFVKFGNPTPTTNDKTFASMKWNPLTTNQNNIQILNLDKRTRMVALPERKRMKFWDNLRTEFFSDDKLLKDEL